MALAAYSLPSPQEVIASIYHLLAAHLADRFSLRGGRHASGGGAHSTDGDGNERDRYVSRNRQHSHSI